MPTIRSLRLNRGMTLVELALEAGVPARTLGAIEYGLLRLDPDCRARLAGVFGLAPDLLRAADRAAEPAAVARGRFAGLRRAGRPLAAALISGLLLTQSPLNYRPPTTDRRPPTTSAPPPTGVHLRAGADRQPLAADPFDGTQGRQRLQTHPMTFAGDQHPQHMPGNPQPLRRIAPVHPTLTPTSAPPVPTPTPVFALEADGPHGCPLVADAGRIVITQGYGEGTHAPGEIWGALDLALDGDGDGIADPGATDGITIVATHGGVARVFPDSWPGGNFILVENTQDGWNTAYAHLSSFAVADGQTVSAGTPLGSVGSTGMATGPHLHYEVRHGGVNLDPSELIGCDHAEP